MFVLPNKAVAEGLWPGLPPDCWPEARVVHSADDWKRLKENFKIEKIKLEKPVRFENVSPNKAYSFKTEWFRLEARISIYAEKDSLTIIKISDERGVSDVRWVNEKLLFMRIWWGRIAIEDVIFDVERDKVVYTEPAMDGYLAYQQYQAQCKGLGAHQGDRSGCKCVGKENPPARP